MEEEKKKRSAKSIAHAILNVIEEHKMDLTTQELITVMDGLKQLSELDRDDLWTVTGFAPSLHFDMENERYIKYTLFERVIRCADTELMQRLLRNIQEEGAACDEDADEFLGESFESVVAQDNVTLSANHIITKIEPFI